MQTRNIYYILLTSSIVLLALSCSKDNNQPAPDTQKESEVAKYYIRTENPSFGSYRAYLYNLDYSLKWKVDLSGQYYLLTSVANQTIYFTSDFAITAVNIETGTTRWQVAGASGYFSNLAIRNDTLYCTRFATNTSTVQARSALTGELYWSVPLGTVSSSLTPGQLDGDHYYFIAGALQSFNLGTRKSEWQKVVSPSITIPFAIVHNHIILLRPVDISGNADLYSIDKGTGYVNWNRPDASGGFWMYKNYIISKNAASDQGLIAFDTATADIAWKRFNKTLISAADMAGSRAFIAGYHNPNGAVFFCADVITGDTLWKRPLTNLMFDKLLVVNNVLYANVNPFSVTPAPASGTTMSFNAQTGALIDSAKIGPDLMVLTASGKLLY